MNPAPYLQARFSSPWRLVFSRAVRCASILAALSACDTTKREPLLSPSFSFGPDTIVLVGQRALTQTQLAEHKGSASASEFSNRWVRDTLISEGVRKGLLTTVRLQQANRSVLSRRLLEQLYARALASGPPTDSELDNISKEKWFLVDRPAAAQVSHLVVRTSDSIPDGKAYQLAQTLAARVRGIVDSTAFIQAAKSANSDGLEVIAEPLPPMTADGRGLKLDREGRPIAEGPKFDETFARAANNLEVVGAHSGVVRTPFGYHVLMLERRLPAYRMPIEEQRSAYAAEIAIRRARQESEQCIESAKARLPVTVEPGFQEILEKSQVLP